MAKRLAWVLLAVLFAVGCAEEGGEEAGLGGVWVNELGDAGGLVMTFEPERGVYSMQVAKVAGTTRIDSDIQRGNYQAQGARMFFQPTESSCAAVTPVEPVFEASFTVEGDYLTLVEPEGAVSFRRHVESPMPPAVLVRFGCFTGGVFSPSAVGPVTN